jgi:N-glycosylase/DNA lyase
MREKVFCVRDYDLAATLTSGQAFRWEACGGGWTGVVHGRRVTLRQRGESLAAETAIPQTDWQWLADYLQVAVKLDAVLATFPEEAPMLDAVSACRGLRLLRQDPWECLASFILSSTKQIVQIRQIVATLCKRYGTPAAIPAGEPAAFAFPTAEQRAGLTEAQLRACKMGFRAPYLLATARLVAEDKYDLQHLGRLDLASARAQLLALPGVGRKIADCVLLFGFGFPTAFPLDVWVLRALRELYFRGKRPTTPKLKSFAATHFGPNAGYAQQYLFHFIRTKHPKK